MIFNEELKSLRLQKGLSQQALGDCLEIPRRTLQDWELGKRTPPIYVQKMLIIAINAITEEK